MDIRVQTIYVTFNGEQNHYGIGSPTIFLRLAGCHIRCYNKTLGVLCDTPEALQGTSGHDMDINKIGEHLDIIRQTTKINLVCLTGGDPLWRNPDQLHTLFEVLQSRWFNVTVETSGTLDIRPYTIYENVSFVVDYKLKSAGVKGNIVPGMLDVFTEKDYIKFVLFDVDDYNEFVEVFRDRIDNNTNAKVTVGPYWGGNLEVFDIVDMLKQDGILGDVLINMQTHKMAQASDYTKILNPLT